LLHFLEKWRLAGEWLHAVDSGDGNVPFGASVFERVTIVGVGLLGASLGMALKERKLAQEVIGVGRTGSSSLQIAKERGAIDRSLTSFNTAVAEDPDLIVLCTPVRQFPEAMSALRGKLRPSALVTDVGSTKAQVMAWANEFFDGDNVGGTERKQRPRFVGSHPMAGSEKKGPAAARADLYEGGLCLICPGTQGLEGKNQPADEAARRIEALWQGIGMRTLRLDPVVHDQWVATISHLPHAIAFALVNAAFKHPEMLAAAAGGFLDSTRIASSDADMWTDIFLTNRSAVTAAIDEFTTGLAGLRGAIERGDEAAIRAAVVSAKASRDGWISQRRCDNGSTS
jgi:prephenate dehydrogenase